MTVAEYLAREYHACCAEVSVPIAVWVVWRPDGTPGYTYTLPTDFYDPYAEIPVDPFRFGGMSEVPLRCVVPTIEHVLRLVGIALPGDTIETF